MAYEVIQIFQSSLNNSYPFIKIRTVDICDAN